MKQMTWDNPNKMHFESEFKTFNKQTNLISTGNVLANTQMSSFIRAWNDVVNGSYIGKPGDFLKFDMKYFRRVPKCITDIIYDKAREKSVILYEFFIWKKNKREIIGHVLTDYNHNLLEWTSYSPYSLAYSYKWESAILEAIKYITA